MTLARPPSLAARVAEAWEATPDTRQTVKRLALRFDPEVRITPPRRLYRFRVFRFRDGSRLRTMGRGHNFRIVAPLGSAEPG